MLPRKQRLVREADFRRVYRKGATAFSPSIVLKAAPNDLMVTRFGIVVSLKVSKKAVDRNRIKRQISEVIRLRLAKIKTGRDILLIVKKGQNIDNYDEVNHNIEQLLQKTRLYV
ncbi:MAG: ribonuclease P protein component [Patescibacteria group bacterium]|jgi:ribonuclease P protein component